MRGPLDRVVHLLDVFCRGVALSAGVAVIATVAVISYGVLAREVLHLSDVWVTEVTTYLMAYMTFVGTAALAWQSRHLKIDVLGHHLGEGGKRVLAAFATLVMSVVAVAIAVLAVQFWWDAYTSGERSWGMFSLPLWIPYLCLVVGTSLLTLVQLVRLATIVFARREATHDLSIDELVLGRDK
ncbi:Tripartite ATP-independent periplasmic transporter, permease [Paraburkholderia sabiae]|jgi:TRAP-type C4-dicarboxylate transport system permease small subunit|uniref:TRAP transporter small permease n=1 Tax=Paraburkholderia sabiae TaxID=273251 RepID=UPI001CB00201|nr:TRAP transporter small permease [Paraburkholderia sabiae]CAG9232959.1 Tripartite ATP-independent periplasmic transporter, permease [Paraburkholderia sabiae]